MTKVLHLCVLTFIGFCSVAAVADNPITIFRSAHPGGFQLPWHEFGCVRKGTSEIYFVELERDKSANIFRVKQAGQSPENRYDFADAIVTEEDVNLADGSVKFFMRPSAKFETKFEMTIKPDGGVFGSLIMDKGRITIDCMRMPDIPVEMRKL